MLYLAIGLFVVGVLKQNAFCVGVGFVGVAFVAMSHFGGIL